MQHPYARFYESFRETFLNERFQNKIKTLQVLESDDNTGTDEYSIITRERKTFNLIYSSQSLGHLPPKRESDTTSIIQLELVHCLQTDEWKLHLFEEKLTLRSADHVPFVFGACCQEGMGQLFDIWCSVPRSLSSTTDMAREYEERVSNMNKERKVAFCMATVPRLRRATTIVHWLDNDTLRTILTMAILQ